MNIINLINLNIESPIENIFDLLINIFIFNLINNSGDIKYYY